MSSKVIINVTNSAGLYENYNLSCEKWITYTDFSNSLPVTMIFVTISKDQSIKIKIEKYQAEKN